MTIPTEHMKDAESILQILPELDRPEALATLRAVNYPVTRFLSAVRRGDLDIWQVRTALRRFKEDAGPA